MSLSADKLERFREKRALNAQRRKQILADLVWMFVPRGKPRPWQKVAEEAVNYYRNEGGWIEDNPFLESHSDSFISVKGIMSRKSDIRRILAEDGAFIIPVRGQGIRRPSNKSEIIRSFTDEGKVVAGMTERYNYLVETANQTKGLEMPTFRLALLPQREVDGDEQS